MPATDTKWRPDSNALRGRVAVVAGATRGAGRGIAAALGEAGATVICTGRSSRSGALKSDYDRPETIEETAELVSALGGRGIGFTDTDGSRPDVWRYTRAVEGGAEGADPNDYR